MSTKITRTWIWLNLCRSFNHEQIDKNDHCKNACIKDLWCRNWISRDKLQYVKRIIIFRYTWLSTSARMEQFIVNHSIYPKPSNNALTNARWIRNQYNWLKLLNIVTSEQRRYPTDWKFGDVWAFDKLEELMATVYEWPKGLQWTS